MSGRRIAVAALVLLVGGPALQAQVTPPPTPERDGPAGIGKAKLGASVEEVKKAYPKIESFDGSLCAAVVRSPFIQRFVLRQEKLAGLPKPVDVELRFWKDKLWVAIVCYGDVPEAKVMEALRKQHGEPTPGGTLWPGRKSTLMISGRQRWYSVFDNALSEEAARLFMEDFKRLRPRGGPAAEPTAAAERASSPGATPPAATPPSGTSPPAPTPVPPTVPAGG